MPSNVNSVAKAVIHFHTPLQPDLKLKACLKPGVLNILPYRLGVPPDDTLPIKQLLDKLKQYVKAGNNEALRDRDLFSCKQGLGESFNDFYVRVKSFGEAVDICNGTDKQCEETAQAGFIDGRTRSRTRQGAHQDYCQPDPQSNDTTMLRV